MKFGAKIVGQGETITANVRATSLKADDVITALQKGAEILQTAVRRKVDEKASTSRKRTYKLTKAITFTPPTGGPAYGVTHIGWEKTRLPRESTRNRNEGGRSRGKRVVSTVDDVGRILEYSPNRQLRHMEEGSDEAMDEAVASVEDTLDEIINGICGAHGL